MDFRREGRLPCSAWVRAQRAEVVSGPCARVEVVGGIPDLGFDTLDAWPVSQPRNVNQPQHVGDAHAPDSPRRLRVSLELDPLGMAFEVPPGKSGNEPPT